MLKRLAVCSVLIVGCSILSGGTLLAQSNLLKNPGLEQPFSFGGGWVFFSTVSQGTYFRSRDWAHAGIASLKLLPNETNVDNWSPSDFSLGQQLPTEPYRGKPLYFSGWMKAEGGAVAIIRLMAIREDGQIAYREIQNDSQSPVFWRDILDVPDVPLKSLIFTCSVRGKSGTAYFDDLVVSAEIPPGLASFAPDPGPPLLATATVNVGRIVRRIPPTLYGMNLEWVFNGHAVWDQYKGRLDENLLNLASDVNVTLWRFPGGVFSNHYLWTDGIGPQDLRPVRPIEPGTALSPHGFGTDEAWDFVKATGAKDMMVTVNSHTGTAEEAAAWVGYLNNGTRRVTYWEVGNELYLRTADRDGKPYVWTPEQYVKSFNEFASAMKAVDPGIKVGADAEFHYPFFGCSRTGETGCWTDVVLRETAGQLDFLSVHNGFAPLGLAPLGGGDAGWDVRTVYAGMLSFPVLLKGYLQDLGRKIDGLAGSKAAHISIAVTEWGPLFNIDAGSRLVDHVKTLGSALYTASMFKTLLEEPRVEVAIAFKLLDESVYGWIGPRQGKYATKAPYYAFQLYSKFFNPLLVETNTYSPTYETRSTLGMPAAKGIPYLDIISSTNDDRSVVSMIVVNKHFDRSIRTMLFFDGFAAAGTGTAFTLTGTGLDANTGTDVPYPYAQQAVVEPASRFYQGGPEEIWISSSDVAATGSCLEYEFPPHSVTALVLRGKPGVEPGAGCAVDSASRERRSR